MYNCTHSNRFERTSFERQNTGRLRSNATGHDCMVCKYIMYRCSSLGMYSLCSSIIYSIAPTAMRNSHNIYRNASGGSGKATLLRLQHNHCGCNLCCALLLFAAQGACRIAPKTQRYSTILVLRIHNPTNAHENQYYMSNNLLLLAMRHQVHSPLNHYILHMQYIIRMENFQY